MGTIPAVPVFPAGLPVDGAVLETLCTALTWCFSGKPVARLTQATTQSIASGSAVAITWDTKIVDRDSGWSSGNSTRYTAQTPGIYLAAANVIVPNNATGFRRLWFTVTTGSNNPAGTGIVTAFGASGQPAGAAKAGEIASAFPSPYMYDGDYLQVLVMQNSGSALSTTVTGGFLSYFNIDLLSG